MAEVQIPNLLQQDRSVYVSPEEGDYAYEIWGDGHIQVFPKETGEILFQGQIADIFDIYQNETS